MFEICEGEGKAEEVRRGMYSDGSGTGITDRSRR